MSIFSFPNTSACNLSLVSFAFQYFLCNFAARNNKYTNIMTTMALNNGDLENFRQELINNPFQGSDLGGGVRKIRMAISSLP